MPSVKTLRVYANPWHHLDHEGLPAGACACDPDYHTPARKFVGATLEAKEMRAADKARGVTSRHRVTFKFSDDVQEVPVTVYYLEAVKRGELIAADKATAEACGFKPDSFKDPKACLAEEQMAAIQKFKAETGEAPPWAPLPAEPADRKAKSPKAGE